MFSFVLTWIRTLDIIELRLLLTNSSSVIVILCLSSYHYLKEIVTDN